MSHRNAYGKYTPALKQERKARQHMDLWSYIKKTLGWTWENEQIKMRWTPVFCEVLVDGAPHLTWCVVEFRSPMAVDDVKRLMEYGFEGIKEEMV